MSTRISAESYTHLLSPAYREFIQTVNSLMPEDFGSLSIAVQRTAYNHMLQQLGNQLPTHLLVEDQQLKTPKHPIPIRSYQVPQPSAAVQIIYFHGGGFVLGDLNSHHGICADLCAGTGLSIMAVDYRLAPEQLFPAALEDAVLAYQTLAAQTNSALIVMGDSAGGCLAAHVAHQLRGQAKAPSAQLLIYPVLGSDFSLNSYERYALAPLLTTEDMQFYWQAWLGKQTVPNCLKGIPLATDDFSDLPNTVIFSAEYDPLVGEAELYCQRIKAAGGQATWYHEPGLTHGYLHARQRLDSARSSFMRIQQVLKDLSA